MDRSIHQPIYPSFLQRMDQSIGQWIGKKRFEAGLHQREPNLRIVNRNSGSILDFFFRILQISFGRRNCIFLLDNNIRLKGATDRISVRITRDDPMFMRWRIPFVQFFESLRRNLEGMSCFSKKVDFLLLSGNIFQEADASLRARLKLLSAISAQCVSTIFQKHGAMGLLVIKPRLLESTEPRRAI